MDEYIKREHLSELVLSKLRYLGDARIMNQNDEKMLSEIDGYEKAINDVHELILDKDLIESVQPTERVIELKELLEECRRKLLFLLSCEIENTITAQQVRKLIEKIKAEEV